MRRLSGDAEVSQCLGESSIPGSLSCVMSLYLGDFSSGNAPMLSVGTLTKLQAAEIWLCDCSLVTRVALQQHTAAWCLFLHQMGFLLQTF